MSLVWHIVLKDGRRLAGPLALWLALLLAHALLVAAWSPTGMAVASAYEGQRYFSNTCGVIVTGIGFILAAWLVMEDSLVSTQAFWRTRAIGGLRLLAAKSLGALLMFSLLPVVVLAPVWLWCGFGGRELALAGGEVALQQALCSLGAFALGSITETSGQFLVRLLGGAIVLPAYLAYVLGVFSGAGTASGPQSALLAGVILATGVAMIAWQFLTRRTGGAWGIFLLGIALMLPAGRWPLVESAWLPQLPPAGTPASSALVFTAEQVSTAPLSSLGKSVPVQMTGRVTGAAPGTVVRVNRVQTWWVGAGDPQPGPSLARLEANGRPTTEDIRRVAGLHVSPGAMASGEWAVANRVPAERLAAAGTADLKLRGVVQATVQKGAMLGELPLRSGATLRTGSSLTRVGEFKWVDDKLVVQIEERDAWLATDSGVYSASYDLTRRRIRPMEDGFVVLNRGRGIQLMPAVEEVGTLVADSILAGRRNLVITPPEEGGDWLEGAVIMKVRFRPGRRITQALAGEPLGLTPQP